VTYSFLLLALLFLIPGLVILLLRPDLRRVAFRMALCSLPFALTESWFYPSYWEPRFVFDLADRIGFGIEDLLFVAGLGAFSSTAYAFFFKRGYGAVADLAGRRLHRGASVFAAVGVLVAIIAALGIPMIYGSVAVMLGVSAFIGWRRRDLVRPMLLGGLCVTGVYSGLCGIYMGLLPDVFVHTWHIERFSNVFVLGIPLEEILYACAAGTAATAFYPYVFGLRLQRQRSDIPPSA
jgi:hypothetical protein